MTREGFMEAAPLYAGAFRMGRIAMIVCLITLIPMLFILLAELIDRLRRRREPAA